MKGVDLFLRFFFQVFVIGICCSQFIVGATYLEVQQHFSPVYMSAATESVKIGLAWNKGIFQTLSETAEFYKIKLYSTDSPMGWISKTNAQLISESDNPDPDRLGLITFLVNEPPTRDVALPLSPDLERLSRFDPLVEGRASPDVRVVNQVLDSVKPIIPTIDPVSLPPSPAYERDGSYNTGPLPAQSASPTADSIVESQSIELLKKTKDTAKGVWPQEIIDDPTPNYSFMPDKRLSFIFPRYAQSQYPKVDVNGFVEMHYQMKDQSPTLGELSPTDNRWTVMQNDPITQKLPRDILAGQSKMETRLKFDIAGQFSKDLMVEMHVEQEPDFPGIYDVKVKQKDMQLTFGHYDVSFENGQYVQMKKGLNGFMFQRKTKYDEGVFAIGKERSTAKKYEGKGTGRAIVSLGNRSILAGSVKVWVNNSSRQEGVDFTINYFKGEVTFKSHSIPSTIDFVEIVYEFTNPIEAFIPSMGQKDFLGGSYKWRAEMSVSDRKKVKKITENWTVSTQNIELMEMGMLLKHPHVVLGSERVSIGDISLSVNDDYVLKNRDGIMRFQDQVIRLNDTITVEYEYFEFGMAKETLVGKDTTGPYYLNHQHIIPGTLSIFYQGYPLSRVKDYTVHEETGQIQFSYPLPYPKLYKVDYHYYDTIDTPPTKKEAPFYFDAVYLRDSSQPREENSRVELSATENVSLVASQNVFYTNQNPLDSKEPISISFDGQMLTSDQFEITNAYKGEITISSNLISGTAAHSVGVRYTYVSTQITRHTFYGIAGWRNTPYVSNDQFVLTYPTVKFNGLSKVLYWDGATELTLLPNRDYLIDYGADGQTVQIRFLTVEDKDFFPDAETSVLTQYPGPTNKITLIYNYVPNDDDGGRLVKETLGVSTGGRLSKHWTYDVEVAVANNNFSKPQLEGSLIVSGNGVQNHTYSLGQVNIVKDSEAVFMNGVRLTKDKDYFLNFAAGTVRFVNLTPTTEDLINISFQYLDASSTLTAGESGRYTYATRFNTGYSNDVVRMSGYLKWVDKDFNPLSPIKDKKGSVYYGGSFGWTINPKDSFSLGYEHVDSLTNKQFEGRDVYLRSQEVKTNWLVTSIPFFDMAHNARYYLLVEDPTAASGNIYGTDTVNVDYSGDFKFGPSYFKNQVGRRLSKQISAYLDGVNQQEVQVDAWSYQSVLDLKNLMILGQSTFKPNADISRSKTDKYDTNKTFLSSSWQERQSYGLNMRFAPMKFFDHQFDIKQNRISTLAADRVTADTKTLTDRMYATSFRPFAWFHSNYSYKQNEAESVAVGQKGETAGYANFTLSKFSPYGLGRYIGVDRNEFYMQPFRKANVTYRFNQNEQFKDNDRKRTDSVVQAFGITQIEPWKGLVLSTIQYSKSKANNAIDVATTTSSSNYSSNKRQAWNGAVSLSPVEPIFNWFKYSYSIKHVQDDRFSALNATSATSNTTEESFPEEAHISSLQFNPGLVKMFGIPLLAFSTIYNHSLVDKDHQKRLYYYNAVEGTSTFNVKQDMTDSMVRQFTSNVNPLNILPLIGSSKTTKERLSRNILSANTGLTIKEIEDVSLSTTISPFSFLNITGVYGAKRLDQQRSPSLNISDSELDQAVHNKNSFLVTDAINEDQKNVKVGLSLRPFSFFSVRGSGEIKSIETGKLSFSADGSSSDVTSNIQQNLASVGVAFTPFTGFSLSYDYGLVFSSTNESSEQKGYSGLTKAEYTPLQTPLFKVRISYVRTDGWGYDLNTIEQTESISGTGDELQTQVVERNDTIEEGVLSIDINMPNFFNTPFDERFVITGQGFIKRVTNRLDDQRISAGQSPLSYDISGLSLKGTIHF